MDVVYLDFQKALNTVPRKVRAHGIAGNEWRTGSWAEIRKWEQMTFSRLAGCNWWDTARFGAWPLAFQN